MPFFMMKKYFYFLVGIFSFPFTFGQTLSSAPTLTFTSNTGISADNIATDGEGGSVNITDIDIQIYNISNTAGAFVSPLSWENAGFYTAGAYTGLTANVGTGTKGMLIKSVSGAEFKLHQFAYLNWGESQTDGAVNTIKGYRNGIEVASTTFQGYNNPFLSNTIVLSTAFENVDEVRFYISAGGYQGAQQYSNHSINAIQVSSPVLGLSEFELKSKIQVYPNPSSNKVKIDFQDLEEVNVEVLDVNGRKLFSQQLENNSNAINIEDLSSGIYIFKMHSNQGTSISKVIKN
jgi:hypothetical protein